MPGLVVCVGGDDAHWTVVDDVLWDFLKDWPGPAKFREDKYTEIVDYLVADDTDPDFKEYAVPDGCPPRVGKVLRKFHTQTIAPEPHELDGIRGILTIPML